MHRKKLVVIGGGAAGFFCAINAAKLSPNLEVEIWEKGNKFLQKVKVSGGGRCNVTHACFDIEKMASRYPRGQKFVRKAFHHFFTSDTIAWFQQRGVALKTEADGRMFPVENTSEVIINCLVYEANKYGVKICLQKDVNKISPTLNGFELNTNNGEKIFSTFVMLACGGFQRLEQFNWLQNLGFKISEPVPSLFTFNFPKHALNKLMGVTVPNVSVKIVGTKFLSSGPILITHWGLSGPAILKLSAFAAKELALAKYQFKISINWHPAFNENTCLHHLQSMRVHAATQRVCKANFTEMPNRLWEFILAEAAMDATKNWADISAVMQNKLAKLICGYEMQANGKTTFKEEFVTAGGIDLSELDSATMMVKKHPGLFVGGEIIDVDGITGGYNFQHAWTSGYLAAKAIAAIAGNGE